MALYRGILNNSVLQDPKPLGFNQSETFKGHSQGLKYGGFGFRQFPDASVKDIKAHYPDPGFHEYTRDRNPLTRDEVLHKMHDLDLRRKEALDVEYSEWGRLEPLYQKKIENTLILKKKKYNQVLLDKRLKNLEAFIKKQFPNNPKLQKQMLERLVPDIILRSQVLEQTGNMLPEEMSKLFSQDIAGNSRALLAQTNQLGQAQQGNQGQGPPPPISLETADQNLDPMARLALVMGQQFNQVDNLPPPMNPNSATREDVSRIGNRVEDIERAIQTLARNIEIGDRGTVYLADPQRATSPNATDGGETSLPPIITGPGDGAGAGSSSENLPPVTREDAEQAPPDDNKEKADVTATTVPPGQTFKDVLTSPQRKKSPQPPPNNDPTQGPVNYRGNWYILNQDAPQKWYKWVPGKSIEDMNRPTASRVEQLKEQYKMGG